MKRCHPAFLALAGALVAGLAGCTVTSDYMNKVEPARPIAVSATEATVVFVRPSGWAGSRKFIVLDQNCRFLGENWGSTYYAVTMPAGRYTFVVWGEGTNALRADVEAGKVYYVELGPTLGWWSPRLRLFGIKPGAENWNALPGWLAGSTMLEVLPSGQQHLDASHEPTLHTVQKGLATWDGYDAMEKAERSLAPGDGVPQPVR